MAADGWAVCPRCLKRARVKYQALLDGVAALQAKLTEEERRIVNPVVKTVNSEDYRTFREDYEFYINAEGEVEVSYSGHCQVCELGIDFEDRRQIEGVSE